MPQRPDRLDLNRTDFEVMKVLWKHGDVSAREAHDALTSRFDWAYSTTRTTLERMVKKGLVEKHPFHGLFLYRAAVSRVAVMASRVKEFAESVLELDPAPVVSLFTQGKALNAEEIRQLEALLAEPTAASPAPTAAEPTAADSTEGACTEDPA